MFTKAFNWLLIVAVLIFSIGLYIAYFWIADNVRMFLIFKTAMAILRSPQFYLIVLLLIGLSIIFDVLYIVVVREWQTPIYMLFKSLFTRDDLDHEERERLSRIIAERIKHNMYDL